MFHLYAVEECSIKMPWKENAIGASTNVDAVHENPNNDLTHCHIGRFWDVPKKIIFPKHTLLKHGWISWLKGFPEHRERTNERNLMRPAKPMRLMNAKLLPKKLCNSSLNGISPTMNLMKDAPEIKINQNSITDENFIDRSFKHGLIHVKRTAQHIF